MPVVACFGAAERRLTPHEAVVGVVPGGRLGDPGGDAIGAGAPACADVARADVARVDPAVDMFSRPTETHPRLPYP